MDETKVHLSPSPLVTANFFSRWFFLWLGPLFAKGFRSQLKQSDFSSNYQLYFYKMIAHWPIAVCGKRPSQAADPE